MPSGSDRLWEQAMEECVAAIWKRMHAFSNAMDVCVVFLLVKASRHEKLTRISEKRSSRSSSWPKYLYNRSRAIYGMPQVANRSMRWQGRGGGGNEMYVRALERFRLGNRLEGR